MLFDRLIRGYLDKAVQQHSIDHSSLIKGLSF